jgi:arylsulfatase A-like enzyme
MTGLPPKKNGVCVNVEEGAPGLPPGIGTIGHLFRGLGFRTAYCGKWHLSSTISGNLSEYGFDEFLSHGIPDIGVTGYDCDKAYIRKAKEWINDQPKPYFIIVSLVNPHDITKYPDVDPGFYDFKMTINELPENWQEDLSSKPSPQLKYKKTVELNKDIILDRATALDILNYYYFLNLKTDSHLGELMDGIDMQKNLFIFTSDHGEMGCSHGLLGKGPFAYKEQTHVPLIMVWGDKIAAGTSAPEVTSNLDVLPTLAGLFGVAGRGIDMFAQGPENREVEFWYYGSVGLGVEFGTVYSTRSHSRMRAKYSDGSGEEYDLIADLEENINLLT